MIPKDPVYLLTAAVERVKDTIPDQDAEGWLMDRIATGRITWAYVWREDRDRMGIPLLVDISPMDAIMENPDQKINLSKGTVEVRRPYREVVECRVVVSRHDLDRELANITASPEATDLTHSGMVGRPTPKHLYLQEMRRRADVRLLQDSVAQESHDLRDWMKREHPRLNLSTAKVIENAIRDEHRELLATRNAQRSGKGKQRMA